MDYPETFSNQTFSEGINQPTRFEFLFSLPLSAFASPSGVSNDIGKDQGARETNEKQGT